MVYERRPGFPAAVGGGPHRRGDRGRDAAGEAVGWAVVADDERDGPAGAQPEWHTRCRHDQPLVGEPGAAADVRRRCPADQRRTGPVGDDGGVHRVVEVRVHRQHGRQTVDAEAGQRVADAGQRRRQSTGADLEKRRSREEPVGHQGGVAVVEKEGRDTGPRDRDRGISRRGRLVETLGVVAEFRPAELQPHGDTLGPRAAGGLDVALVKTITVMREVASVSASAVSAMR